MRPYFRRCGFAALLVFAIFLLPSRTQALDGPPNIIFLLTDDQRWNTLGCMGNPIIQTPNVDALAREGVIFDNAFVTTSICSISRASFLTGQYARRHDILDFEKRFTREALAQTYPVMMRHRGYRTGFIGKWGVGRPPLPENEFDYWAGFPGQGRFLEEGNPKHLTARMGDQALEFLAMHDGRPFCLSMSFKAPHAQDFVEREFPPDSRDEGLYQDAIIPIPKADEKYFRALPEFIQASEARRRWGLRFATPEMAQANARDYYRLITGIDREVGRIVEALRERGLAGNTIIIFTSDNGFYLGDYGLSDKWFMHEESIRVPLVVHDPRLPAKLRGTRVKQMALNIDLAPTLLDYAGIIAPSTMQGESLRPLVEGRRVKWRTDWFYEHLFKHKSIPHTEGVRSERWKYVRYFTDDATVEELYDLKNDPQEERNLIASRLHQNTLKKLRARREEFRETLQ